MDDESRQERSTCDLCEKRCPVGSFGCGRGERAYGMGARDDEPRLEGLAGKLAEAGRIAQIKGAHISAAGKEPGVMFDVIPGEDAAQLELLLDKLLAAWEQAHAARHHGRGGHRHHPGKPRG
ncbi:MAG: hypothetical protein ACI36V_00080 [Coriobacteriales bacterium]